ncbi:complex I intermediate-associated protein 30-domain-containing protein [Radiomyces spectabilis]|uniref:complex I intermediate-associated protein 30-domain-containing protein n=1 Tax=Radiomyces spectabilis TaxID=64574 RepID=UPI00221F9DBC|nr:complex I intermediate-associated protein 30-domain-containing protein [Radiomyces spectabilis]KAI8379526.1 complex I intermediate-associated protein 30-domain-containing protein [Radiomyces spectabilis]
MEGLQGWQRELPMASLNTLQDLDLWAIGCDKDIGGFSEAHLDVTPQNTGRFHGHISLELPANREIQQSGYAAIRTKAQPSSMFGTPCWDTSIFRYLALRVRGDRRRYFVNIQTDGVIQTDLYQHRLFLRTPGDWETVMIPFRDFILTNNGMIQEQQVEMFREKVKTVGISLMDRQEGPFDIEIDWIKAMNTEFTEGDLDRIPPKEKTSML